MKTLLIMPHMDDEAISCGGLIQQRLKAGGDVYVLAVYGRSYDYGREDGTSQEASDFKKVKAILGYQLQGSRQLKEGEPGGTGFYKALGTIERTLMNFQPDEVVGPGATDLNQDHRHLSHVMDIAMRPINQGRGIRRLEFIALDGVSQAPDYYIPMSSAMLQLKQDAIAAYSREARTGTSPRSPENITAQARVWGAASGFEFAEAYKSKLHKEGM